jgi:hypothetical protein
MPRKITTAPTSWNLPTGSSSAKYATTVAATGVRFE